MPRLVGMEGGTGELGYWGKMDTTIDWCESNYTVVPWIAEFWYVHSSFLCFLFHLSPSSSPSSSPNIYALHSATITLCTIWCQPHNSTCIGQLVQAHLHLNPFENTLPWFFVFLTPRGLQSCSSCGCGGLSVASYL